MKHRTRKLAKRWLAMFLCLCMTFPSAATLVSAAEEPAYTGGICEHHPEHTEDCGYIEAVEGHPCTFVHDDSCGYQAAVVEIPCDKGCSDEDGDGNIIHQEGCAYQSAVEEQPCTHSHDDSCGYVEAVEGHPCTFVCEICSGEKNEQLPLTEDDIKITSLNLLDFTEHGESTSSDVNLLERTDGANAVKWDVFNPYTLEIGVSLPAGADNNTLTLTLPNGMKFVNLNPDNLAQNGGIASVTYEKPEKIYGYQPENGPLTVVFKSGVTSTTVTVSIQPDVAFFPVEKRNEGLLIKNAIQVELKSDESKQDTQTIPVNVQVNEEANAGHPSYEKLLIGDISDSTPDVAPGETYNPSGHVWTGWFTYNEKQNYRLRSELVVVLSVPNDLTLTTLSEYWALEKGNSDSENDGYTLWTLTKTGLYTGTPSIVGRIGVKIPDDAEPGTTYAIKQHSISVTTFGQDTPWEVGGTENDKPLWTLTVQNPEDVKIGIAKGDATKVYDYTQKLASNGQPFTDYNTSLAGCVITNNGVADIEQDLIYKATFDQTVQFVTAVGIPCGWDETEDEWLPTKITITTDKDTTHTISVKDGDYSAIRDVASLAYPDYGFILRAADIPEFDPAESIVFVEVELPGLPKGYKSSGSPVYEYAGSNNAYAGVWGRVRENRGDTKTGTNNFSLYLKDDADTLLATQISTTTIVNNGQLSASIPTSKITVDNVVSPSVSSGDAIHISQKIVPHNAYGSFHYSEVLWYDPVIYLLEPEDMTIEEEKFTLTTTSSDGSTTTKEINYSRTKVTDVSNLPDGYQLYEYTLNDKVLLGWWSGDWENTSLHVDFDYNVDPTAKTLSYDVQDLIFYKSSLGFAVFNNPVTDTYNLNGGKAIGGVTSNTFTVQAVAGFNIAASIQIEGEGDDKWYTYDPENPTNTTAVFTDGATANVRVTVINNSGQATNNVEVYVPIPKKDGVSLGNSFFSDTIGFDMFVGGEADTTGAEGWSVQYGQVARITYTDNGVPDEIELKDGTNWSSDYKDANMIKLSLSEDSTLENGEQAQIILQFKATTDTSQTDSMNIFKSWWKYSAGGTAMVDAPQNGKWIYNFGTLLQNGVVSGTVYLDTNGNGIKGDGENGISGVTIKAVDAGGREYPEQKTDADGQYSFKSLPGDKSVTITVLNPGSTDPSQTNAYRFSKTVASTTEQIGSDVTATEDHQSASKKNVTLLGGTAIVNAGLIEPCTVTFAGGENGSVSPGTVKIFPGQKLEDVLNQAPSVSPSGKYTHTGWYRGAETTLIPNEQLLEQTITGDTTFTAQYSTYTPEQTSVTVTKAWEDKNNQDGIRPESITVKLLADGQETKETLTLSSGNNWTGTFSGLDKYKDGKEIVYTIEEVKVNGYNTVITGDVSTGFTITNTHTPETTEVSGSKTWDDADNQDGKRPDSITIRLYGNGKLKDTVTVTAEEGWKWGFTDLPKYENGQSINYTITEDAVDGYTPTYTDFNVTNTYTPEQTGITVTKAWSDNNNQDGIRPESVTVKLLADSKDTKKELVLSDGNSWTGAFTGLDKYQNGQEIVYTIEEAKVNGYDTVITGDTTTGFTITNTHTPETTTISGSKTWDDADDQDGKRPDSITIRLYADGTQAAEKEVTDEDGWTWTFENLPKYKGGKLIDYTIQEESVPGYTPSYSGYDITNSYTPGKVAIPVTKSWQDNNNQDGLRSQSVTVKLLADGKDTGKTLILNEGNSWSDTFTGLDEYASGEKIIYTIEEISVDGYDTTITGDASTGFVITNSHTPATTEVSGSKTWDDADNQDGKRPASITIRLYGNGTEVAHKEVTAEEGWKWSFANMPKYEDGKEIVYTIEEVKVNGYDTVITGDASTGFVITNSHTPAEIDLSGSKTWDDADDQDGKRPDSITIRLHANGEQVKVMTVTEEDGWKWNFTNLPEYENGSEIRYTITEDVISGYQSEVDGMNVTNHYTPGKINIPVTKNWQDQDDADGIRPDSITVKLYADGKDTGKELVLNQKNNWTGSFDDLDEYADGVKIVYTIAEVKVDGYDTAISGSTETGFVISNSHTPATPDIPDDPNTLTDPDDPEQPQNPGQPENHDTPKDDTPQTGDTTNLALWIGLLVISGTGLTATVVLGKKKRYRGKHMK